MTKKQFFKKLGLNQPQHKTPYIAVIKKYKGYLSYWRLYLLIITAIRLRRYGVENIISYVEAVIDSSLKEKRSKNEILR